MSATVSPFPLGEAAPAAVPSPVGEAADSATQHTMLIRWFEDWETATRDEREMSCRDRDYVDNKQWTADEERVLRQRGQPALVINRIVRKVDYLRGFERRLRSDPKAFPRTPVDEANADAATQALRFVSDDNSFDQIRSAVWDNMIVEGLGGAEVVAEPGQDGIEVRIHHIPWSRIWRDPHAMRLNFSDARYMGSMAWMDRDQAEEAYPDHTDAIGLTMTSEDSWGSFADRPRTMSWTDTKRSRILVVQGYWQEGGDWWIATFTRGGFLVPPMVSPYIDRRGKTCSPLRLRATSMDRDNNCYGPVRQLIGMQDELNKRRSKALHLLNVRQVKAQAGAVDDVDKARRELAKPDGYIEVNGNLTFEIIPTGDMASGQFELLHHVSSEIDATGPNAAMAGKDPREQSGRAIQAQQQGGAVENEPMIDSLRQWDREIYEAVWMRVRQFWDGPKWLRTTDDDSNTKWVGLNRAVTVADELAQMAPDHRAMVMQQMALQPGDPRLQQVLRTENDISDLDVDITVEDGPDISTLQSEQFNFLQGRQDVPLDLLIKYSSLPKKADMLKDLQEQQKQQADQAAQAQQHALAMEQAKIALLQAQAALANAGAAEKQAGAIDRVHGVAMDHAQAMMPQAVPAPAAAQALASQGVNGDTMLAHINPDEAAMLKAQGGAGTINPATGLPQFYDTGGTGSDADQSASKDAGAQDAGSGFSGNDGIGGGSGNGDFSGVGPGQMGPAATGAGMANNGLAAHNALDDKAVSMMDIQQGHLSGVNAASSAMNGFSPSFADRALDFAGISNPGGFLGSDLALGAAGLVGGIVGGPLGAGLASGGVSLAQGRGVGASIGAALGGASGLGAASGASFGNMAGNFSGGLAGSATTGMGNNGQGGRIDPVTGQMVQQSNPNNMLYI